MRTEPIAVDAYIRVSTEEQAREGLSIDTQRDKVDGYARLYNLEVSEVIVDAGVSAKTLDRPGLARHLERLRKKEVRGTLVVKLDRLTRTLRDWTFLHDTYYGEKRGCTLISVHDHVDTATATGRMMLHLMMTIAQWERETIAERTRDNLQNKIARGERCGKVRFGYDLAHDKKTLILNPEEQAVIRLMRDLRLSGFTLRKICEHLRICGIRTKEGLDTWKPGTVRQILNRRV